MSRLGLVFTVALAMLFACAGVVLAQSQSPDDGQAEDEEFVEDISGLEAGERIPGKYIVVLEDEVSDPASVADDLSADLDLETTNVYDDALEGFAAEVPSGELGELRSDPRVKSVVQDRVVEAAQKSAARVKRIDRSQRSIRNVVQDNSPTKKKVRERKRREKKTTQGSPTGIRRIDANASSVRAGNGTRRVKADVAVLDTGIYKGHRDLNVAGGTNCVGQNKRDWSDRDGHGTHVAGTAAARDNKIGVVGVAPGARLWAVRVLRNADEGTLSDVVCGVDWVTARSGTIEVANMSIAGIGDDDGNCGNTNNDPLHQAICNSVGAGVFYAVAAGNEGTSFASTIPAAYDEVLTATAMADSDGKPGGRARPCAGERDDRAASFSNFATDADTDHTIAAPGVCIRSTWENGKYKTGSGTSMSAPHVAGTAALCIATGRCPGGDPQRTMDKLRSDAAAPPDSYGFAGDPNDPIGTRYYGYLTYAGGY